MTIEEHAFKIKTGNFHVLQLHLYTDDLDEIKSQLALRLSQTPDFFTNTPVVLDFSAIAESNAELDLAELTSFMQEHGMRAAGFVGGSAALRAAGEQTGLVQFSDGVTKGASRRATDQAFSVTGRHEAMLQEQLPGMAEIKPAEIADHAAELPQSSPQVQTVARPTRVIDKPVRTGQRIYAEGGNLVVLAIVNAGAELIADGDIHVYAPMRGRAIAGAQGNESARIFVQGMEAELLSIAGCFKVFEDGVPENVRGKPAQVHLEGSRLCIEPLHF